MIFPDPLVPGRLVRRYKRFLADVVLDDGQSVIAHVANSGSMRTVCEEGARVWLSPARTPGRALAWTWEIIELGQARVGVNTATPNRVVAEALAAGQIPALAGYSRVRREVPYAGRSRIDLLLEDDHRPACYVEIKNVTMKAGDAPEGVVAFPDAVTARGAKHVADLATMVREGARAVLVYVVQRTDGDRVRVADEIDPAYGRAFDQARAAGVEVVCLGCDVDSQQGIRVNRTLSLVRPSLSS
ncbi:DNA/RNA nuclease SfsA [Pararhodospirillum photometricum]|uniref:DNA/RNA nuclease SfsA n=1 Tax=Pararhodospirillum photometricum TaxID=1084 RepID=UPI00031AA6DF|nr:DNA/RNA nuclease SfsA [Pararhodospirillum photometricum]